MGWPLSKGGGVVIGGSRAAKLPNVDTIGDSIPTYYGGFGRSLTQPTNIPGVVARYAAVGCAAGAASITWDATARTLQWAAPGDTPGAPVAVADGVYLLPSGTPGKELRVDVYPRNGMPVANVTQTLTCNAQIVWRRGENSVQHVADAFTNRRFNFRRDYGIGGNFATEIAKRYGQVLNGSLFGGEAPDIVWEVSGLTNDIVANVSAYANAFEAGKAGAAARIQCWDAAAQKGIPVIANTVTPRSGSLATGGVAGTDGSAPATFAQPAVVANQKLADAARTRKGVYLADVYTPFVDVTTNRALNYATQDGLHQAGDGAQTLALPAVTILDTLQPPIQSVNYNIGALSYYDAVNAPGGNLLNANQGSFAGTGGSLSTGMSLVAAWAATAAVAVDTHVIAGGNLYRATVAGTTGSAAPTHTFGNATDGTVTWLFITSGASVGFGAGYTLSRDGGQSTAVVGQVCKIDDPAGGPQWQCIIISGAVLDPTTSGSQVNTAEQVQLYPSALNTANITAGEVVDTSVQIMLGFGSEANCYGVWMDGIYGNSVDAYVHDNRCLRNSHRGIRRNTPFTLALEPMPFPAFSGSPSVLYRVKLQAQKAKMAYWMLRNFDVHKVQG